ncbi:serine hydrolase domain-containing protein [Polaribacter ponticola]|uniref:Serine hydrolase n=1 Tax=Polaribacter ponticola TaxID=2978475 RepID=A0ABT5S8Y4_9FLAO|nr:serine hydrolase domain-containing protein [Polaribacter sp. MSW5]MDD7913757.1 serine hydrolase [Polaribacter sp. MSW5]
MKQIYKFLILFLALIIISCNNTNKDKNRINKTNKQIDDYSAKIDSLIQTTSPRYFNGVILITQNGDIKYSKAYGYSNFENKIPITLKDNFRIQSNSKQITAVLTLKEVDNGKLNLKSPISKYLPEIKQTWADTVTIHQLLNNTSGITSIDEPLLFDAGTEFYYSNVGYGLLGRIIEKVTGKEYIDLANNLFKKLEMHNSYCYELGKANNGLINGYRGTNNEFILVDINTIVNSEEGWKDFIPAGGIISNAYDLNIWDKNLHNGKLINPQTYKLMTSFNHTTDFFNVFGKEKVGYGYGVCISNEPLTNIGHGGKGIGFGSFKFFVPEKDLDVIVLENVYNEDSNIFFHFEREIREIVLNSNLVE